MKYLLAVLLSLMAIVTSAQRAKKLSIYLVGQYNKPFLDWHMKNNPTGIGIGLETFVFRDKKVQPTVDISQNVFLQKAEFSQPSGSTEKADDIKANTSILAGLSFYPIPRLYFSFAVGPTLVNGSSFFTIKPSMGVYIDKNRKWIAHFSFLGIQNYVPIKPVFDGTPDKEATGYLQLGIGHRLF
jgi:hypothetical protein